MAILKNLIVNGVSRFIGKVFINDSSIGIINGSTVGDNPKFTDTNTTYADATTAAHGLMTATDKTHLDSAYAHAVTNKGTSAAAGLYKITANSEGHITATSTVTKTDITNLGIPASNTTYADVTTAAHGLMTAADKIKLNTLTTAVANTTTYGYLPKLDGGTAGFLRADGTWKAPPNTTYAAASSAPPMDGTAAAGSSSSYARADHVHPTDTSRASADSVGNAKIFYGTCATGDGAEVATYGVKQVVCSAFKAADLIPGAVINVLFSYTNGVAVGSIQLDVNNTGAKYIKYIYNGAISNIPGVNYIRKDTIHQFTYDGTYWIIELNYNTNTNDTSTGYTRYAHGTYQPTTSLARYRLCLSKGDGTHVVVVSGGADSSAATTQAKTITTQTFNPFDSIYYFSYAGTYAANSNIGAGYLWTSYSNINLSYSFNTGSTLTSNKDVYMVAEIVTEKADFSIAGNAINPPTPQAKLVEPYITQTLPKEEDNKIYIKLGHACSTTNISISYNHPIYTFKEGRIRLFSQQTELAEEAIEVIKGQNIPDLNLILEYSCVSGVSEDIEYSAYGNIQEFAPAGCCYVPSGILATTQGVYLVYVITNRSQNLGRIIGIGEKTKHVLFKSQIFKGYHGNSLAYVLDGTVFGILVAAAIDNNEDRIPYCTIYWTNGSVNNHILTCTSIDQEIPMRGGNIAVDSKTGIFYTSGGKVGDNGLLFKYGTAIQNFYDEYYTTIDLYTNSPPYIQDLFDKGQFQGICVENNIFYQLFWKNSKVIAAFDVQTGDFLQSWNIPNESNLCKEIDEIQGITYNPSTNNFIIDSTTFSNRYNGAPIVNFHQIGLYHKIPVKLPKRLSVDEGSGPGYHNNYYVAYIEVGSLDDCTPCYESMNTFRSFADAQYALDSFRSGGGKIEFRVRNSLGGIATLSNLHVYPSCVITNKDSGVDQKIQIRGCFFDTCSSLTLKGASSTYPIQIYGGGSSGWPIVNKMNSGNSVSPKSLIRVLEGNELILQNVIFTKPSSSQATKGVYVCPGAKLQLHSGVAWESTYSSYSVAEYDSDYNKGIIKQGTITSTTSIASGTATNLSSLKLEAGIWIVKGQIAYNAGGTAANYRAGYIGSTSTGAQYARVHSPGAASGNTILNVIAIVSLLTSSTVYLSTQHGADSTLTFVPSQSEFTAVKIA